MIPSRPRTCGGIAVILNAVFVDDKRDAGLFVFADFSSRLAQQQQSSEMNRNRTNTAECCRDAVVRVATVFLIAITGSDWTMPAKIAISADLIDVRSSTIR
jgi:hypothetical protein